MKILMVSNLYPPYYIGESELRCALVAEAMHQRGHDVKVLTSRSGFSSEPVGEEIRGVKVQRILSQYLYGFRQCRVAYSLGKEIHQQTEASDGNHTVDGFIGVRPQLQDVRHFIRIVDRVQAGRYQLVVGRRLDQSASPCSKAEGNT